MWQRLFVGDRQRGRVSTCFFFASCSLFLWDPASPCSAPRGLLRDSRITARRNAVGRHGSIRSTGERLRPRDLAECDRDLPLPCNDRPHPAAFAARGVRTRQCTGERAVIVDDVRRERSGARAALRTRRRAYASNTHARADGRHADTGCGTWRQGTNPRDVRYKLRCPAARHAPTYRSIAGRLQYDASVTL